MAGKNSKSKKEEDRDVPLPPAANKNDDNDDDDSSSDEEDDDLVLEGVIVRNPDFSGSDDTSSEEEEDADDDDHDHDHDQDDDEEEDSKPPPSKKAKSSSSDQQQQQQSSTANKKKKTDKQNDKKKTTKKKKKEAGPEVIAVEFTFCDMNEKFFHGIKALLTAASPIFAPHSSALSDLLIENASVGTVTSTEGDVDGTVYGFASVLNVVTTHQDEPCIKALKKACLDHCPAAHKKELEVVLSGKTKRPAGFYLHGRMVNMPLEIVQVLHEQLVIDMDWAVKNAKGSEEMRKSLDFGAFVLLAPTYRASGVSYYKLFDDEIFASHAEFTFEMEVPKSAGMEETPYCTVVVMTKTGHRDAMKSLAEMVNGGSR